MLTYNDFIAQEYTADSCDNNHAYCYVIDNNEDNTVNVRFVIHTYFKCSTHEVFCAIVDYVTNTGEVITCRMHAPTNIDNMEIYFNEIWTTGVFKYYSTNVLEEDLV